LEGAYLKERFGASHVTGSDVTRERVLTEFAKPWKAIHLGVHGVLDTGAIDSAALLLADSDEGESSLTLTDVLSATLRVRILTMAACWGAASGAAMPDEALDLPSAMISRGAGGVMSALWAIADEALRPIIASFYGHWLRGSTPAHALAHALVEARRAGGYNWLAFALAGT
jgi:CHAT domain-containing protein